MEHLRSQMEPCPQPKDPIVRRCSSFFTEAALMPTLDPDAMREAERGLWAKMTAGDA
jgi:hypothetical protein